MVQDALRAASPNLAELAKRASITPAAIYRYSRGTRTPGRDVLRKLAKVLRRQAGELSAWADQLDAESNR